MADESYPVIPLTNRGTTFTLNFDLPLGPDDSDHVERLAAALDRHSRITDVDAIYYHAGAGVTFGFKVEADTLQEAQVYVAASLNEHLPHIVSLLREVGA